LVCPNASFVMGVVLGWFWLVESVGVSLVCSLPDLGEQADRANKLRLVQRVN